MSLCLCFCDRLARLSSAAHFLARMFAKGFESLEGANIAESARLQTRLVLIVVVNASAISCHVDSNQTVSQPVFTAVFSCMFCIHGCASSLEPQ